MQHVITLYLPTTALQLSASINDCDINDDDDDYTITKHLFKFLACAELWSGALMPLILTYRFIIYLLFYFAPTSLYKPLKMFNLN